MDELQSAWEAVQNGDLVRAQRIAAALAKTDPENADAWYLLSAAVAGERQDVFRRKALDLDPTVVARYFEGEAAEPGGLPVEELESVDLPTEFFTYPDNRPEVNIEEPAESEGELAPAVASPPARRARARSGGSGLTNALLFILGVIILVVLYFFITSLV